MKYVFKKSIILFCIVLGLCSLVACGETQEPSANAETLESKPQTPKQDTPNVDSSPTEPKKEKILANDVYSFPNEYYGVSYPGIYNEVTEPFFLRSYGFSLKGSHQYLGMINDKQELIPYDFENVWNYSTFSNGYAYINFDSQPNNSFSIIHNSGNIIYQSPNDANYQVLCGSDGFFYVEKKVSGYDVYEVSYWIVSADGKWTSIDFVSNEVASDFQCYENAILQLGDYIFVNMKNGNIYYTSSPDEYTPKYAGFTKNNELIWVHTDSYHGQVYITDSNNNTKQLATTNGWGEAKYSEDLIYISDNGGNCRFINLQGEVVIDLSQYKITNQDPSKREFKQGGIFDNGIAPFLITGKDGQQYYMIIDKKGKLAFDPISLDRIGNFSQGYVPIELDFQMYLIDNKGNITPLPFVEDCYDPILEYLIYIDGVLLNGKTATFYDLTGNEIPITIAN